MVRDIAELVMDKILVTGADGFLGGHLIKSLDGEVYAKIPDHKVDYIINLASISSVEESIKEPRWVIKNNIQAMLDVLEYARTYPPKLLLHMSTVESVEPRNPYAASKAAQEAMAIAYQSTYGLNISIAMSHNIIGLGQTGRFIPTLIDKINRGETVDIYTEKSMMGFRTYNPVANVVDGLMHILNLPPSYYHIDSGKILSNLEMAQKVAKLLGKKLKYKLVEGRELRPGYSLKLVSDGVSLTKTGWKPPQTLDEGMAWISP